MILFKANVEGHWQLYHMGKIKTSKFSKKQNISHFLLKLEEFKHQGASELTFLASKDFRTTENASGGNIEAAWNNKDEESKDHITWCNRISNLIETKSKPGLIYRAIRGSLKQVHSPYHMHTIFKLIKF